MLQALTSTSPEAAMRIRTFVVIAAAALAVAVTSLAPGVLSAQSSAPAALSGVVMSQEEGAMEGVIVNARRQGANFTVSVVSDAQGKYSFPRTHLEPGRYALTIRAVGYDLSDRAATEVKPGK